MSSVRRVGPAAVVALLVCLATPVALRAEAPETSSPGGLARAAEVASWMMFWAFAASSRRFFSTW